MWRCKNTFVTQMYILFFIYILFYLAIIDTDCISMMISQSDLCNILKELHAVIIRKLSVLNTSHTLKTIQVNGSATIWFDFFMIQNE